MKKTKPTRKRSFIYTVGLIIILIIIFGILYRNSYYGTLQVKSLDKNLIIFIDNQRKTISQDINPEFKLRNGEYTIVVSKERFWPWIKEVEIKREDNLTIQPFFIPQNTSGLLIGKEDSEYQYIMSLFQKDLISSQAMKKISDSNTKLKTSITAIDFYKNRQDVVIIASGDGVYALEINTENFQNFQPIYKGKNPVFVKKDNSSIYIFDSENLILVNY